MFKKLLEPTQIKQVKLRNRIVQRNLEFYDTLAKGSVGLTYLVF